MVRRGRRDRQLDVESRTRPRRRFDGNRSSMIAHHRLHNREAQTGAMLFAGVVGSEQPRAFLRREARAGVGDFQAHGAIVL